MFRRLMTGGLVLAMTAMALVAAATPAGAQGALSASATPADDLADGQTITVEATGFTSVTAFVAQCEGTTFNTCDPATGTTASASAGTLTFDFEVSRFINGVTDCSATTCYVYITEISTQEEAVVPLSFVADGPPPTPASGSVTIVSSTPTDVVVDVSCADAIVAVLNASVTQTKSGIAGGAFGGVVLDESRCDGTTFEVTIPIEPAGRRLVGKGRADVVVDLMLTGATGGVTEQATDRPKFETTPVPPIVTGNVPAGGVTVEILGLTGRKGDQAMAARITCATPLDSVEVNAEVSQWVGRNRANASGVIQTGPCDGVIEVTVPIEAIESKLKSGPAQGNISVWPDPDEFVAAVDAREVTVDGKMQAPVGGIEIESDAITLDAAMQRSLTITYSCDPTLSSVVEVRIEAQQYRGVVIQKPSGTVIVDCLSAEPTTATFEIGPAKLRKRDAWFEVSLTQRGDGSFTVERQTGVVTVTDPVVAG